LSQALPSAKTSARYLVFRSLVVWLGKMALGYTCVGGERTPESGPLVVAANHTRYLDPVFVCMSVPRRIQWMAKKEIFVFPFRRFFYFVGAFPVDRQKGGRAALRAALDYLGEGWALGIFPEGTHRTEGVSREAKSGAIMLAARSGAKILPVYVGRVPGPLARLRGERFRAYVGEPISIPENLRGREAYRRYADELLREIYALPETYRGAS
jgi:1-acyl-sn-glycerol-3-phosphate acyltransferase